ncbi:type I polyketide synthase [Streptomyces iconiensis]|uniref:SDR family NAD(P)-dependent oxidoreductase n=1 Tax=Streptomyces iconiensis TaxID=1384038 RepID=A0ABT6ZZJ4_9ACTN|nr:type I polyketide synthase [Streptomyces iconiensis]MDJ1134262.1 SDR family NAD(P)-dependent oxidoreductase [Streptomyces iconiensis]
MTDHLAPDAPERAIAIVGASCRLPGGVHDLDSLWDALRDGRDAVGEVPQDRFDARRFVSADMARTGRSYTAAGGFLDDIAGFDAGYFGISPKEATQMDPQHRLLLELTAEALDDAAISPARLAGSDTAVYVGISDASYGGLNMMSLEKINPYTMVGAASSLAANRLSHAFDLHGPSMTVDTACSSSLVALDRACHTLWEGTSRAALCGGANVLLSPLHYVGFSQASMLSKRGRCAAFSAQADGFVRAEGGGLVVLKRLRDALADGDRVLGVVLGSGSNSDGRTTGVALPSARAQEDLLRRVYKQAGVDPDELVYFEAHGTGTLAGDPLEAEAIGRALGVRRITGALPIGSIKTNVGHLEPASGIAGLCKALLVLRHGIAPASLHADTPNPDIDFTGLGLSLTSRPQQLPARARPVVGVNSFGFGGANAHVALTAAPAAPAPSSAPGQPPEGLPLLASARTPQALSEAASAMARRLAHAGEDEFYDLAYTSCLRRGLHEHRAAVFARTPRDAARGFAALGTRTNTGTAGTAGAAAVPAREPAAVEEGVPCGQVTFVFAGNGSQWAGMGADLMRDEPVFHAAVEEADAELSPRLGWSVAKELHLPPGDWQLEATEIAQPLLFAVQLGIVAVLRDRGVTPAMVLGHSVGEVTAAHAAGALTLPQAAQVITERSRVQAATAGQGRMAAVGLTPEQAATEIAPWGQALEIAAVNSPKDVTVAGKADALAALGSQLALRGCFFRDLGLEYAFHSSAMDPQAEPLTTALRGLAPHDGDIALYSTVTGGRLPGSALDAEHWWHNLRRPVRFAAAVEQAAQDGGDVFVEIGPHPVLRTYLRRVTAARAGGRAAVVPTLHRETDGVRALARVPAALLAAGAETDWNRYFPRPGAVAALPAYPWQRERHWSGDEHVWTRNGALAHPLLGGRVTAPHPVWEGCVEPGLVPWLADHRVAGSVVMPATGYAEMALAAGREALGGPAEVEHLDIQSALVVPWAEAPGTSVQTALHPDDGTLTITSTTVNSQEPRPHVRAQVRALLQPRPADLDLGAVAARCPRHLPGRAHYAACSSAGLDYGPAFQVLTALDIGDGEVLARFRHDAPGLPYTVHPSLLDGALQAGAPLLADLAGDGAAFLPAAIGALRVWDEPSPTGAVWVRERSRTAHEVCWDITVTDDDGRLLAQLDGCRLRRVAATRGMPVTVHETQLRAAPRTDCPAAPSPLPAPRRIGEAAAPRLAQLRRELPDSCGEVLALLKDVMARRTATVFAELLPDRTLPFSLDDLVAAGSLDKHRRVFTLLIPLMEDLGLLDPAGPGRWRLTASRFPVDGMLREAAALSPDSVAAISLAARHCSLVQALLRGDADPLEMFVTDHAAQALEHFYDLLPVFRFHNRVAQALVREIVAAWPRGRTLRVLEVGAGTGATTAALLPLLPTDRTHYCFSDVSAFFFPRAKGRFAASDFIDYRTLDLAQDPTGQGFAPHSFDLVVAGFALHTAPDLSEALNNVATLLAPGGQLLATEAHDPLLLQPYFGYLDSFYGNTDTDLRPRSLLLPRDEWPALLNRCGYTDVLQAGHDTARVRDGFSVLLAAVPATAPVVPPAQPAERNDGTAFIVATESAGEGTMATALGDRLTDGTSTARFVPMTDDEDVWAEALQWAHSEPSTERTAVVLLLSDVHNDAPEDITAQAGRRAEALLALTAAISAAPHSAPPPELWLVTRPCGTVPSPGVTHESDAALWGMARNLVNDGIGLTSRRISLEPTADTAADARRLARELLGPTEEDEILLTASDRFVPREVPRPTAQVSDESVPFALRVDDPGLSYRLAWEERDLPRPGPGEVLIEVRAAALNYRDIMQSVGLLPEEAIEGTHSAQGCGLECAGVVVACGEGTTRLSPGDRVAGMAPATLASHTVTDARAVWRLPDHMSFTAAATMPVAYATAHYGLDRLARLRCGETVLVHGAAGGVGLAAIRYAHAHGAHVIATAGSDLKGDMLRALGVQHVLDSRALDFAVQVKQLTDGRGVDVVVNSLAGEAMARSLELLRPGGRFIELGKRDIFENKPLPLRHFRNNIAFFGVDLTKVLDDERESEALSADLGEQVRNGTYSPLLHTVHPAARVDEAFRLMQHSRHIGKVVVAFDPLDEPPLIERSWPAPRLQETATYLVTGGTGGFGAATAQWLADLGARHVALVSRRGAQAPEAEHVLATLTARGVTATAYAADVTDLDAMREVVATIDATGHPLRGAVHCAMHLDDALFTELSGERIAAVMAPKITGAAVLDLLLRERECDLFLMYSSETATLGNVKQTPYAAGNLYLEALVRRRRQEGKAGLAIAWGAIADVGYVARNGLAQAVARFGLGLLSPHDAFAAAAGLLGANAEVAGVIRSDWGRGTRLLPSTATPRLSQLLPRNTAANGDLDQEELLRTLTHMPAEGALASLTHSLREVLAGILQMEEEGIDPHGRLDSYGLDSLMATELLVTLNQRFGVDIPPMELLRSSTGSLADVAQTLYLRLGLRPPEPAAPSTPIPHQAHHSDTGHAATPAS